MNKIYFIFGLALLWSAISGAEQNWPSVNLNNIEPSQLKATEIIIDEDPVYKTVKRYQAYPLTEIIKNLKIPEQYQAEDMVIVFTSKDGYRVAMAYNDAFKEQGFVAFRDSASVGDKNWLEFKFGTQKTTPAPFYLVWPKQELDKWRYPWPFQLTMIRLEPSLVYFGAAAPKSTETEIHKGFNLFAAYCIRCHSVNLAGGQLGPELNVPKNISEYFIERELAGFILNAPAYRAGTKMPIFEDTLSTNQVRSIMRYLKHMKTEQINVEK